jgi:hypothetical protein
MEVGCPKGLDVPTQINAPDGLTAFCHFLIFEDLLFYVLCKVSVASSQFVSSHTSAG